MLDDSDSSDEDSDQYRERQMLTLDLLTENDMKRRTTKRNTR